MTKPELSYHNGDNLSNPNTADIANIPTPDKWFRRGMSESEISFLTKSLRVLPAIVSSLAAAKLSVLSVDISTNSLTTRIHIYCMDIPGLIDWALNRVVHPEVRPHGKEHQVVYTVNGIEIFALLNKEAKEKYFPG